MLTPGLPPPFHRRFPAWFPAFCLCVLPLLAYSNSLGGALVLDSGQLILADPRVRAATAENVDLILRHSYWWPYGESGLYRPVTTLTYLFNYAVLGNGAAPAGYHLVNLALHLVNCLLVFLVTSRVLSRPSAFVTAAIWSVLPLSVEAVTNIPGRADLLAALAVLSGLLLYTTARSATGTKRAAGLIGVALAALLGNFSKESAVVLLPIVLLLEWTVWRAKNSVRASGVAIAVLAPPLVLMAMARAWVFAGAAAPEFAFVDNPIAHADFWSGRLTALRVTARYLGLLVWPRQLSHDYSFPQIPLVESSVASWSAALAAIVVCVAGAWLLRRRRDALFFAGFAVIAFLPVANLLFPTGTIMAERLMYLPSVGLAALFALFLEGSVARRSALGAGIVAGAIVLAFGARTYARNPDWHSELSLWQSAVAAAPNSAKAHRGLAEALYASDPSKAQLDRVIAHAENSVRLLEPLEDRLNSFQDHRQAGAYHLERATLLRGRGGPEREIEQSFRRARQRLERSLSIFDAGAAGRTAVNQDAKADAYRLLAAADLGLADFAGAERLARAAIALAPMHPLGHQLLTEALLRRASFDAGAVALATGALVTGDQQLGAALIDLYRTASGGDGCAVVAIGNAPALNPKCPSVQAHVCAAVRGARDLLRRQGPSRRMDELSQIEAAFSCAVSPP